ncbi:MAG: hypothetical protein O3B82_04280, partial [Bacteroidetes bacterium]|nr:hypothetical protein [Bacteroidota bacterium]
GLLGWLYFVGKIDFGQTIHSIAAVYAVVMVLNVSFVLKNTRLSFKPDMVFVNNQAGLKPDFYRYTGYLFLTYVAMLVLQRMDFLMVSSMKGIAQTGIYAIAVNIAVLIEIPTRSILQIANPKLSEAIHQGNQPEIQRLYQKTSLNQFILGALALLLIWVNIDLLYYYMPNGNMYQSGKWAVFYLGIGKLFVLLQGNSAAMLIFSKRYYLSLILHVVAIFVGIVMGLWLIPIYGLEGAAIATACVWLATGIAMAVLIWHVYKMQPLSIRVASSVALFTVFFILNYLWDTQASISHLRVFGYLGIGNIIGVSIAKTLVLVGGSIGVILYFRLSEDIHSMAKKILVPLGIKLRD